MAAPHEALTISSSYRLIESGVLYIDANIADRTAILEKAKTLDNQESRNYFFNPAGVSNAEKFRIGTYSNIVRNARDQAALDFLRDNQKGEQIIRWKESSIFFTYNSSELSQEAKEYLTNKAKHLNENQDLRITITGHASVENFEGDDKNTIGISKKRAEAVRNFLTNDMKVDPSQISLDYKSDDEQQTSGSNDNSKYYRADLKLFIPKNTVNYE